MEPCASFKKAIIKCLLKVLDKRGLSLLNPHVDCYFHEWACPEDPLSAQWAPPRDCTALLCGKGSPSLIHPRPVPTSPLGHTAAGTALSIDLDISGGKFLEMQLLEQRGCESRSRLVNCMHVRLRD